MASVNPNLKPMAAGREVRDYKHASRTFVDNNYELQTCYGNLPLLYLNLLLKQLNS